MIEDVGPTETNKEPSALDAAFEKAQMQAPAVIPNNSNRYLIFRPYIDPISIKPYKPQDKGYYFKNYNNVAVKLICYTLEDNGFREVNER